MLVLLAGCAGGKPGGTEPADVEATISPAIGTVVTVTWRTEEPTSGHVAFGVGDAFDRATEPGEQATEHTATLVGLPPETEVQLKVVSDGGESDVVAVTTGALPGAPTFTAEGEGPGLFVAVPFLFGGMTVAALVDPEGRVVWQYEDQTGLAVFRTHPALDGSGIIYAASQQQNGEPAEDSRFVRVSWDGQQVETIDVPWLAHDFVELPDGTLVSLAYETRDDVQGNKLVAVSPDGTVSDLWSAWDCFDPAVDESIDASHGWTHANALDYDAGSDAFLVGLRNLQTIVSVDRTTGACNWSFGGEAGDVRLEGGRFMHQHQFSLIDGGMLVFDNNGAGGSESRVLEYDFEPGDDTAAVVREIRADPPLYSFILGDVHRLAGGDTVVVWSVEGVVDLYAPDDSRRWRLTLDDPDLTLGFSELLEDPGRP